MSMEEYDLEDVAKALTWIFLLFPHFALSHGLSNINMITIFNQICDTQCNLLPLCNSRETLCSLAPFFNITAPCCDQDYFDFDNYGIGRHLMYLFVVGAVAFVVLLLVEYEIVSSVFYAIKSSFTKFTLNESNEPLDADVLEEKDKVQSMTELKIQSYNLVVNNMSKVYGKFVAVNNMCVAVEQ